jgi:hypothetical protein
MPERRQVRTAPGHVMLHTGYQVPAPVLMVVMSTLEEAWSDGRIAPLDDLRKACRNPDHVLESAANGEYLLAVGLVSQLRGDRTVVIHDAVRAVVLAAVRGEGPELQVAPVADVIDSGHAVRTGDRQGPTASLSAAKPPVRGTPAFPGSPRGHAGGTAGRLVNHLVARWRGYQAGAARPADGQKTAVRSRSRTSDQSRSSDGFAK